MVTVYSSGECVPGGKEAHLIADLKNKLDEGGNSSPGSIPKSRRVFVVYGHDEDTRTQLEAMLRRWNWNRSCSINSPVRATP